MGAASRVAREIARGSREGCGFYALPRRTEGSGASLLLLEEGEVDLGEGLLLGLLPAVLLHPLELHVELGDGHLVAEALRLANVPLVLNEGEGGALLAIARGHAHAGVDDGRIARDGGLEDGNVAGLALVGLENGYGGRLQRHLLALRVDVPALLVEDERRWLECFSAHQRRQLWARN